MPGETGRDWYADGAGALWSLCPELTRHELTCMGTQEEDVSAPLVASISGTMGGAGAQGRMGPDAGSEPRGERGGPEINGGIFLGRRGVHAGEALWATA